MKLRAIQKTFIAGDRPPNANAGSVSVDLL